MTGEDEFIETYRQWVEPLLFTPTPYEAFSAGYSAALEQQRVSSMKDQEEES